jgi:hypothetical protein
LLVAEAIGLSNASVEWTLGEIICHGKSEDGIMAKVVAILRGE